MDKIKLRRIEGVNWSRTWTRFVMAVREESPYQPGEDICETYNLFLKQYNARIENMFSISIEFESEADKLEFQLVFG